MPIQACTCSEGRDVLRTLLITREDDAALRVIAQKERTTVPRLIRKMVLEGHHEHLKNR